MDLYVEIREGCASTLRLPRPAKASTQMAPWTLWPSEAPAAAAFTLRHGARARFATALRSPAAAFTLRPGVRARFATALRSPTLHAASSEPGIG